MNSPRVLVLDNQGFQRDALIDMLQRLGVRDVLLASDAEQALEQLHVSGGVDIVLCDLAGRPLERLEFLRCASQLGRVRAVVLCSELSPELHRAVGQMASLSGLELLGVLSQPLQLRSLHLMLHRYSHRRQFPPAKPASLQVLPSEAEVRRGLGLGQFRAWFQPKVDLASGALVGAEALARWEHPSRGVLLPKDFLAAMLAYDLIDEMFKHVFEQGLSLMRILFRQGLELELAFNLHASQLVGSELLGHVQRTLQCHQLPGSSLMFELAENGLLDLPPGTEENLLRLRRLGCGLSIDDFGSGFSSLKQLCHLPFSQIKLEGEFVQNPLAPHNRAIITSTLALSRSLNMSLVIEGVSSQDVCDALIAMGCQTGQGYYLARPMTCQGLQQWLGRSAQAPRGEAADALKGP
ncbi:EAL domain-containing protein [Pseudomonas sp. NPDC087697]|uniref:EAL domain-containing response regulator n=1 Tax=Pseudomonas sp. NPDC087697 TaxID=3364447 RepID=UPI0038185DAD